MASGEATGIEPSYRIIGWNDLSAQTELLGNASVGCIAYSGNRARSNRASKVGIGEAI
jgi:hypothetical protein